MIALGRVTSFLPMIGKYAGFGARGFVKGLHLPSAYKTLAAGARWAGQSVQYGAARRNLMQTTVASGVSWAGGRLELGKKGLDEVIRQVKHRGLQNLADKDLAMMAVKSMRGRIGKGTSHRALGQINTGLGADLRKGLNKGNFMQLSARAQRMGNMMGAKLAANMAVTGAGAATSMTWAIRAGSMQNPFRMRRGARDIVPFSPL